MELQAHKILSTPKEVISMLLKWFLATSHKLKIQCNYRVLGEVGRPEIIIKFTIFKID